MEKENEFQIRFHHLDLWSDLVKSYFEYFGSVKPWEAGDIIGPVDRISIFLLNYLTEDIKTEIEVLNGLRQVYLDDREQKHFYDGLRDRIGDDDKAHEHVLKARFEVFEEIFRSIYNDKSKKIYLTSGPDEFCRSCAIGTHCKGDLGEKILRKSPDDKFEKAFVRSISSERIGKGLSGYENGRFYITGELLFSLKFFDLLKSEMQKIDPSIYAKIV